MIKTFARKKKFLEIGKEEQRKGDLMKFVIKSNKFSIKVT